MVFAYKMGVFLEHDYCTIYIYIGTVLSTVIHANSTDRSRKERIRFSHPLSSSLVNSWEGSGAHEIGNACFLQKISVP